MLSRGWVRESGRDSIGVWGRVDVKERVGQGEWEGQHRGVGRRGAGRGGQTA